MEAPDWATGKIDFDWRQTLVVAAEWIQAHCVVPDGFDRGESFRLAGWQQTIVLNFYRVKPSAVWVPERPVLAPAFVYRRAQVVLPQKMGKAPMTSAVICLESVGPALFAGWATGGEMWDCRDHGCGCGWVYAYEPGEAMGMPWPTPLIQITATSEEQTDNIYDALRPMIDHGPLHDVIPKTGEQFIRLPGGGRIDVVTSSATSRLGQRVTHAPQDETGVWTPENKMTKVADTQRRGLAGMGGRSIETTNAWDPTLDSQAKRTAEAKAKDIYRLHPLPPVHLEYKKPADRERIHLHVYAGSPWVDLSAIEAEAAELLERDPAQAERFFGNRPTAGTGQAFKAERWTALAQPEFVVPAGEWVTVGFDGSKFDDATALIGTHVASGHQWAIGIWYADEFDPDEAGIREIDEAVVTAALAETFDRFRVWRVYADPPRWEDTIDRWAGKWGEKRIQKWWTNRPRQMAWSLRAYSTSMVADGELSHDGDAKFAEHIGNAVKVEVTVKDDDGNPMWLIKKEAPKSPLKIDAAMAGCLSWEARGDAVAAGLLKPRSRTIVAM